MRKARSIFDGMFIDFLRTIIVQARCTMAIFFYFFCYGCDHKNRTLTNSPLLSNYDYIYDQRPKIPHFRDLEKCSGYALFLLVVRAGDSNPAIFQLPCGKKFCGSLFLRIGYFFVF